MELVSLYYFTELAKDLHMTRTAERLYISQQTLSNHIARLEQYYGAQLLYRRPGLALTPAGESVLSSARTILKEEANLKDILSDIEGQERGLLRFGASTLRMNTSLPHILPQFSARYPKVEVRLTDAISSELVPQVLNGHLDLAVTVGWKGDPRLTSYPLTDENIYLCVADSLLKQYYGEEAEALKRKSIRGASVGDFAKLPFCLLQNRIGELVYACFAEAGVTPWPYITSTNTQISTTICAQRLAAAFVPRVCLADRRVSIPDDVNVFPLMYKGAPLLQKVDLVHMKDRYLPKYIRYFLELLSRYDSEVEHVSLERIVVS